MMTVPYYRSPRKRGECRRDCIPWPLELASRAAGGRG